MTLTEKEAVLRMAGYTFTKHVAPFWMNEWVWERPSGWGDYGLSYKDSIAQAWYHYNEI